MLDLGGVAFPSLTDQGPLYASHRPRADVAIFSSHVLFLGNAGVGFVLLGTLFDCPSICVGWR